MASSNTNNPKPPPSLIFRGVFDQSTQPTNTTFVQADPATFRALVQKLTGSTHSNHASGEMGPRKQAFKLHERRQNARKLEIKLNNTLQASRQQMMMVSSPVSTLDLFARGSPRTPNLEEEERAIAQKGFYLHPTPLNTPRGGSEPQLLPLFPLHSPPHTNLSS